jgi:hypothetical protein
MRTARHAIALLLVCAVFAGGCADTGQIYDPDAPGDLRGSDDYDSDLDTPVDPETGLPVSIIYSGRYEVTSDVDLAAAGVFGETVSGTLLLLSNFHEDPAGAILELLALYGVPVYSQVWAFVPGFIKDEIKKLLNEYVFETLFEAVPIIDEIAQTIDDIASVSRNVEVVTELQLIGGKRNGTGFASRQEITGLAFRLWGERAVLAVPPPLATITRADTNAMLGRLTAEGGPQGRMTFGYQHFAIRYGDMIMDAVKELVFKPKGAVDLPSYLMKLINCQGVADAIGGVCILGACIEDAISKSSIQLVCTSGLLLLGGTVEKTVRDMEFKLMDFQDGTCDMYDVGYEDYVGDHKIDALSNGVWNTQITVGDKTFQIRSDWEGRRIADE